MSVRTLLLRQAKIATARKALSLSRAEYECLSKENKELFEARNLAMERRNAILKKVRHPLLCFTGYSSTAPYPSRLLYLAFLATLSSLVAAVSLTHL